MDAQLPAWRRPAPVTLPVRLDPAGRRGPTRGQARGPQWRRSSHGFYVPAAVDGSVPEQRVAEAVPLLTGYGVVTGWGALRMHGACWLDGRTTDGVELLPVTVTRGRHIATRGRHEGVRERFDHVGTWTEVAGVRVHLAPRALVDEMRLAPVLEHAVVSADATRAAGLVTSPQVEAALSELRGWQGMRLARTAWALSRDRVKSPRETRLRLVCRDAGLPQLLVNVPVFSLGGVLLGFPDLFDVEAGLAVEYDGQDHLGLARRRSDHLRSEAFRAHRIEDVHVTAIDMVRPATLGRRLRDVRARCAFLAPRERPWTLTPPPGWCPPPGW